MSTELEIRVTAELREIKAALAGLTRDIQQVGTRATASAASGRQLGASMVGASTELRRAGTAADQLRGRMASVVTQAKLLVGGLGVLASATALVRMADTATRLAGQIRLVTKTTDEFNRAQAETFAIAQRTRQSLEGTVGLYARIARTGRTTQAQTLALTESINQAVALSFTTAQAAEAALFQLGQGLGSGTLRGEELNSVLEQTPRLAQAIAKGLVELGKIDSAGQLRKFAADGKLTADLVTRAIQSQQRALREEFAKLEPTVADAFTALKNAALRFVGDANAANGASRDLADAVLLVAENFGRLADALVTFGKIYAAWFLAFKVAPPIVAALAFAFLSTRNAIALATPAMVTAAGQARAIAGGFAGATAAVTTFSLRMNGAALAAASWAVKMKAAAALAFAAFAGWKIGEYLKREFLKVELFGIALAQGLTKSATVIGQSFRITGAVIAEAFRVAFNTVKRQAADLLDAVSEAYGALPLRIGSVTESLAKSAANAIRGTVRETEGVTAVYKRLSAEAVAELARIDMEYSALADHAIAARQKTDAALGGGGDPPPTETEQAIGGIVDQFALMKDAAERALAALERTFEDGAISVRAYYAEKVRLQQASVDADIATAQADAAAAKTSSERGAALTRIIILERQRRDVATIAARDQLKAEEDLVRELGQVQIRLLELQGEGARARLLELEEQYLGLLRRLDAESDTAGRELVRKLINVEAAKAGLDQLRDEFSDVTGALSQLEQTTSAQVAAGLLSNATAEKRLSDARAQAIDQLRTQRAAVAALYDQYKDPETLLHLQRLDEQIAQLSVSTEDWRGKLQDAGTDALTTFFRELADGSTKASDAVRNLAVNFTQSLAAMAAQALAKKAISAIFDAFGGGGEDQGAGQVASAAAAGLAYATPVTTAATALGLAGGTLLTGASALAVSAAQLQAAATTLMVANAAGTAAAAHTGGIVGALYQVKDGLPAGLFAGAPRYHSGGIAGLAPDELPTVLRRGEEVLTRQDPRHRFNGGLGREAAEKKNLRLILVDDQRRVADFMQSPEGDDVLVERIGANAGAIRELLASG